MHEKDIKRIAREQLKKTSELEASIKEAKKTVCPRSYRCSHGRICQL